MRVPKAADVEDIPVVGSVITVMMESLGITDDDLPDIVPDPPEFNSDEEAAAWMMQNFPKVAQRIADLEGGEPCT